MHFMTTLNKTLSKTVLIGTMGLLVGLSALACGDDTDSSSSSSSSISCCLNGSFYECDSSAELNTCSLSSNDNECSRTPSRDDECD